MAKKNRLSRLFSLFLALVMLLSLLPVQALATEGAQEEGSVTTAEQADLPTEGEEASPAKRTTTAEYEQMLDTLSPVVPVNRFLELADRDNNFKTSEGANNTRVTGLNGLHYFVAKETVNGVTTYYVMDPSTPTIYGKVAAVPVTLNSAGNAIVGADPEMAINIVHNTAQDSNSNHRWEHWLGLSGDYTKLGEYYLKPALSDSTPMIAREATKGSPYGLNLRKASGDTKDATLGVYRSLDNKGYYYRLTKDSDGNRYFQLQAEDTSTPVNNNIFKLYQVLTDRVNVENLGEMLHSVREYLAYDSKYPVATHEAFLATFVEAVNLYTVYNGRSDLTDIDTLQAQVDAMTKTLFSYRSQLHICRDTGNQGSQIRYMDTTMYNWDEEAMNELTANMEGGKTNGFLFTTAKVPSGTEKPLFSSWNKEGIRETVMGATSEVASVAIQQWHIYSGLAKKDLDGALDPIDPNVAVSADLWSKTNIENAKEVYTDVKLPFVYDVETGYYVLNSDANAVYFEGEPTSGAQLAIADLPVSYSASGSGKELAQTPSTFNSKDPTTHQVYDRYVTGFQPFATITDKLWKGFRADAAIDGGFSSITDAYLLDGVSIKSQEVWEVEPYDNGAMVYGFGMMMEIRFRITESGTIVYKDASGKEVEKPITFEFSGDDDVWVYIDDKLAMDIGGTHDAIQGQIDFQTGNVTLRSDKYGRVADMAGYYNQDRDEITYTYVGHYGVVGTMYEENIYTGVIENRTAEDVAEKRMATLADGEDHIMRIYYMERGKGRTNCYMAFNLPQTDTLTVEKQISEYFMGDASQGTLSDTLYNNLRKKVYGFTLLENSKPCGNMPYYLMLNGLQVGSGVTSADGHFTLRGDQVAEFRGMDFTDSKTYSVVEDDLSSLYWMDESYTYTYSGSDEAPAASGTGNSYAAPGNTYSTETLSFVCTNAYCHEVSLEPEPQSVVLDYGKPIDVEVVRNAVITGASEIFVRQSKLLSVSFTNNADKSYGTLTMLDSDGDKKDDAFRFTLSKMLDRVLTVTATVEVPFEDGSTEKVGIPVYLIPATQMYYETDFADGIFNLNVVGSDNLWQTIGTPQDEVQDDGNVGDQLYDFTIHKESIPSNAFFADFDGTGTERRYSKHPLYNGLDFDKVDSTGVAVNWSENAENMKPITIDQATGLLTLNMQNPDKTPYIQTSPYLTYAYPLLYHPEIEQYLQVRFKLENFKLSGTNEPQLRFFFYTGTDKGTDEYGNVTLGSDGKKADTIIEAGRKYFSSEYLTNGEFITVTIPLTTNFSSATQVTAFRMQIVHIISESATDLGSLKVDYLYVGPLTDEIGSMGQNHETEGDALFFDFSNDTASQLRYQGSQYSKSGTVRNYDQKASWVSRYGKVNGTDTSGSSIDTTNGVYTIPVGDGNYNDGTYYRYGPYFYMTADDGSHISFSNTTEMHQKWRLNYTIPEGNIYFHVGFRTTNVSFNKGNVTQDQNPYVQCTIAGYNTSGEHMADHPRMVYSASVLNSTTFYQGVLDITSSIRPKTGLPMQTLQCLYIRFVHLYNEDDAGTVEIDYIYVGPEKDPNKVRDMQNSNTVMIDFNNTNNDKQRYSSPMYSGVNHDINSAWDTIWFTWDIKNGSAVLTPTASQEAKWDAYASFYTKSSYLNYKMTGNDYIQVRFRIDGAKINDTEQFEKAGLRFYFGKGDTPDVNELHTDFNFYVDDVVDQGWITHTYDISKCADQLDTLRYLFPAFFHMNSKDPENPATFTIDYIYVGPLVEGRPASQSLFFGFENEEIDQERYDAYNYGHRNYDVREESTGPWKTDSHVNTGSYAYTIDNEAGLLTLEVTNKLSTYNICGPYLATSDLYNFPENRPANQYTVSFVPDHAEYMQIRFRTNDCQKADNANRDMNVIFLYDGYDKIGNYVDYDTYNNGAYIRGYYEIEDGFQTLTMPLTEAIRDMLVISNFGIRFQHMSTRFDGSVDIDYIYVGPGELAPDPVYGYDSTYDDASYATDALFFGFGNGTGDGQRYDSSIYGGLNYDSYNPSKSIGYWATNPTTNSSSTAYEIENGLCNLEVTNKGTGSTSIPGPFLFAANSNGNFGNSASKKSLNYDPSKAEVMQVRFRLNNCSQGGNGTSNLIFLYGGYKSDGTYVNYEGYTAGTKSRKDITNFKNVFQTLTVDLHEDIRKLESIVLFGLRFQYLTGTDSSIDIDYIYVGPKALAPANNYSHEAELSNGSSLFVQGSGVKTQSNTKTYTEASFDFTGTGFDIISRTGIDQATIRVEVQEATTGTVVRTMTVNNKGEMELSQIPVVSIHGLPHGSYKVYIWVNKAYTSTLEILNRGGDFFFDAVRIYDPVDVSKEAGLMTTQEKLSLDAYIGDKEAHDYVKEIRDILLSVADFNAVTFGNSTSGALFVDSVELDTPVVPDGTVLNPLEPAPTEYVDMVTDHLALHVKDYNKVGPKNEVYLSPGEAVVFKLVLSAAQKPVSIDIAAKTLLTDSGILAAGFVSSPSTSSETLNVLSRIEENLVTSTGMYYDLDVSKLPTSGDVYLVIYNAYEGDSKTENILSITDLKVAYKEQPTEKLPEDDNTGTGDEEIKPEKRAPKVLDEPYAFTVDGRTLEAAAVFMDAVLLSRKDETPILDQGTKIRHSLNLASDISMNYLVAKEELDGYENVYLEVLIPIYEENSHTNYHREVLHPEDKSENYYYFTLGGLTAVNMNDRLEATLYMEKDGRTYYSETDVYSIADYAYAQMGRAGVPEKLKALCAELLRYGSSAQTYKGYRTDALVNANMTEDQKAYLSDLDAVTFGNTNTVLNDLPDAPIQWKGKALSLESKVCLKFIFSMGTYTGELSDLRLHVGYTDVDGNNKTLVLREAELYNVKNSYYAFTLDALTAAELRTLVSAQVYAGDSPVSATLQYSADTYGNNKTGALLDLCKALFAYSDSAKAYFAG